MNNRVLGCKIVGCGFGGIMVIALFLLLGNFAQNLRDRHDALILERNLPPVINALRAYAGDHQGTLPPLADADALKTALFPTYIRQEKLFGSPNHRVVYLPNTFLSEKAITEFSQPDQVAAITISGTSKRGVHWVGFLSGAVRPVQETDWATVKAASHLP